MKYWQSITRMNPKQTSSTLSMDIFLPYFVSDSDKYDQHCPCWTGKQENKKTPGYTKNPTPMSSEVCYVQPDNINDTCQTLWRNIKLP